MFGRSVGNQTSRLLARSSATKPSRIAPLLLSPACPVRRLRRSGTLGQWQSGVRTRLVLLRRRSVPSRTSRSPGVRLRAGLDAAGSYLFLLLLHWRVLHENAAELLDSVQLFALRRSKASVAHRSSPCRALEWLESAGRRLPFCPPPVSALRSKARFTLPVFMGTETGVVALRAIHTGLTKRRRVRRRVSAAIHRPARRPISVGLSVAIIDLLSGARISLRVL